MRGERVTHIHTVVVSYNRVELTEQTITSYFETVTLPHTMVVVDNGSDRNTMDRLIKLSADYDMEVLPMGVNRFPGYATNRGWERMPPETTHLHRSDNDFAFLPGWCEQVLAAFKKQVGQVGLRTKKEELGAQSNVGGNNVILRELWDRGLRYDERPWGKQYPQGWTEDSLLSPAVVEMGYVWRRVQKPSIRSLSYEDPNDPYYRETWRLRGIKPPKAT